MRSVSSGYSLVLASNRRIATGQTPGEHTKAREPVVLAQPLLDGESSLTELLVAPRLHFVRRFHAANPTGDPVEEAAEPPGPIIRATFGDLVATPGAH